MIIQRGKYFAWDDAKDAKLGKERRIGFEDVVFHIERAEWESAGGGKRGRTRYSRYAKATFRKDR